MTRLRFFFTLFLFTCCTHLFPATPVPSLSARVVDCAGVLSTREVQCLDALLVLFESVTNGQMAVLFEKALPEGETVETRSLAVAETWKIGHKDQDNGVLLYFAIQDRRNRLEVGYGWEGSLTDARAGDILRGLVPHLQKEHYAVAAEQAIHAVCRIVSGKSLGTPVLTPEVESEARDWEPIFVKIVLGLWVILFVFRMFFDNDRGSRGGFGGGIGFRIGGGGFGGGFRGGGGGFGGGGASGRW